MNAQWFHVFLFVHLIAVAFWLGGMLFTAGVLVPVSRKKLFLPFRGALFTQMGTLFSRISWAMFLLLVCTGVGMLLGKGFPVGDLLSAGFWGSPYGETLIGKLHLFSLMLVISGVHDFWLGPKAARWMEESPDSGRTERLRRTAGWVGRVNLILGLAILWYAVQLSRGGMG
ncbi:MAG: CopD family protein [Balneolaceae bacterium]